MPARCSVGFVCLVACAPRVLTGDGSSSSTDGAGTITAESGSGGPASAGTTGPADAEAEAELGGGELDIHADDDPPRALDILFVIDNSAMMSDAQLALVGGIDGFVDELVTYGSLESVQVMVTTTDVGHPLCTQYQRPDYTPAMGAPIATGCNARINRFTGLDPSDPAVHEEVCTQHCPSDVVPSDPFVAFEPATGVNNVGEADTAEDGLALAKAALRCVLPQGIDGCGYESPLEAMLQAIDPQADHNTAERPFLRDGADLAIVIVSNETDCSWMNPATGWDDETLWNDNPHAEGPTPSSAMCWNAGVECTDPDAEGEYDECWSTLEPLHPTSRYTDELDRLRAEGKEVSMLAVTGVPEVTSYAVEQPWLPVAGGLNALVYRDWRMDDLSEEDVQSGVDLADLTWEYGIGPGCRAPGGLEDDYALPSPRVFEVCGRLDQVGEAHCCVDSICSDDYTGALRCLLGVAAPYTDGFGSHESG